MKIDMKVYLDTDFAGNYCSQDTQGRDTARSKQGYIVMYKGWPITWKSQLQTEICLSSTEREYTGLSYALREVIPLMKLLQEMRQHSFPINKIAPTIRCRGFEDNSGALEIVTNYKYRPHKKHLNIKLHHFRGYVIYQENSIQKTNIKSQLSAYLTKPVNEYILYKISKI